MQNRISRKFPLFGSLLLASCLFAGCSNSGSDSILGAQDGIEPVVVPGVSAVMNPSSDPVLENDDKLPENNTGSISVTVLDAGADGGPELTNGGLNQPGIQLRRFYAWSDAEQARADLAATSFSDGGDRSALADVLIREGGTLIALYPGFQTSSGVVDSAIELVELNDERLTVQVRTQVAGGCVADSAFAAPFRILHVPAASPSVFFRESIHRCYEEDDIDANRVRSVTVDFLDDKTARINWVPPRDAGDRTRYEISTSRDQASPLNITSALTHTITDLIPGVIYTRRITPKNTDREGSSRGASVAVMVDAPSGAFWCHADRDDLEALKSRFINSDFTNCGKFFAFLEDGEGAPEVSDCITQSLEEGSAFTAERVLIGEAPIYQLLVGDNDGNSWLLELYYTDVSFENDFAPSPSNGGALSVRPCLLPRVLVQNDRAQFSC